MIRLIPARTDSAAPFSPAMRRATLRLGAFFLVGAVAAGCGGGGGGDGGGDDPGIPDANVAGTWSITETVTGNCGDPTTTETFLLDVAQVGSQLTVTDQFGNEFVGSVSGNSLDWTGNYAQDGGTTTITSLSATVTGSMLSGNTTWEWSDGSLTCSGTSQFTGEQAATSGGPDTPGPVTPQAFGGDWYTTSFVDARNCGEGEYVDAWAARISQSGASISLLDSTGERYTGTATDQSLAWTGSYQEDGGTTTIRSLTLDAVGDALSGTATWDWTDGANRCSGSTRISASRTAADAEIEPNDDTGTSHVLNLDGNGTAFVTGTASTGEDMYDAFAFVLSRAGIVEVELSHFDAASDDLDLFIADDSGAPIAVSESEDGFELATAPLAAGLRYFVVVRAFQTVGDAPYILSIDVN